MNNSAILTENKEARWGIALITDNNFQQITEIGTLPIRTARKYARDMESIYQVHVFIIDTVDKVIYDSSLKELRAYDMLPCDATAYIPTLYVDEEYEAVVRRNEQAEDKRYLEAKRAQSDAISSFIALILILMVLGIYFFW